jgi:hypothetical protein
MCQPCIEGALTVSVNTWQESEKASCMSPSELAKVGFTLGGL